MNCARCGASVERAPCPRCLLQADLPDAPFAGHFVLGDELGSGGMGVVFAAKDTRIDRRVALKLVKDGIALDEARSLGRLNHPNIVTLYEAGESEGQQYLAMELVEGRSLRGQRFAPRELVGDRAAAVLGARVCPRTRCHSSRHQAGQRAHGSERRGEALGLRHCENH